MAKPISPTLHGVIDYLTVPVLLAAGPVFHFDGRPAEITSTLAGVVLVYSLFTAYRLGLVKMITLPMHRAIDIVFGVSMILAPFVLGFTGSAKYFFVAMGIFGLLVVVLTDFRHTVSV
ncbi:MAG TPA: hypothetical protein VF042_00035 [Gemmatimonadaceae bacterium]